MIQSIPSSDALKTPVSTLVKTPYFKSIQCMQDHCTKNSTEAFQAFISKNAIPFIFKHKFLSLKPSDPKMMDTLIATLGSTSMRKDLASLIQAYTDTVLKPASTKDAIASDVSCLKENNCNLEDLKKVLSLVKAIIDMVTDEALNKAFTNMYQIIGKRANGLSEAL